MLDHVSLTVADISRSMDFYNRALKPLGIVQLKAYGEPEDIPDHVGFGANLMPFFWIRRGSTGLKGVHVALRAPDRQSVDAFYEAAIAAGGLDNGPPGERPQYHPRYYGAFVLDPDGYNIEAVHHGF